MSCRIKAVFLVFLMLSVNYAIAFFICQLVCGGFCEGFPIIHF